MCIKSRIFKKVNRKATPKHFKKLSGCPRTLVGPRGSRETLQGESWEWRKKAAKSTVGTLV